MSAVVPARVWFRRGVIPQAVMLLIEEMGERRSGFPLTSNCGAEDIAHEEFAELMVSLEALNKQPDVTRPSAPTDVATSFRSVPGGNI